MSDFYKSGGYGSDTNRPITLHAKIGTSGNVSTFRLGAATAGYAITSAKTFIITKVACFQGATADIVVSVSFGYADNDVGNDTATARTNPVSIWGFPEQTTISNAAGILFDGAGAAGILNPNPATNDIHMIGGAAGKYMYMKVISSSALTYPISVIITGYEV